MRRLNECESGAVPARGDFKVELKDRKTGQTLELTSETTLLAAYALDAKVWDAEKKRPDWVVIAEPGGEWPQGLVCFVEQKGHPPGDENRPYEQILAGVDHFDPNLAHGREHHDQWQQQQDLPQAVDNRRTASIELPKSHTIVGAIQCARGGTRLMPRTETRGGKTLSILPFQRHGTRGKTAVSLREFLEALGLL